MVKSAKTAKVAKEAKKVTKKVIAKPASAGGQDRKNDIIGELKKLMGLYQSSGDKGRVMAYGKAISTIKGVGEPIRRAEQIKGLPGIGDGIYKKVNEFLNAGSITKLAELKQNKTIQVLDELTKVWGVGPIYAQALFQRGIRTIDQLRQKQCLLTANQKVGLKYFEDFQERIPRATAAKIANIVSQAAVKLFGKNVIKAEACGSFRRGKPTCGDVDVLITRTDNKSVTGMLEQILIQLEEDKFLHERLGSSKKPVNGSEMYMGVCKAPGDKHFRRIDIKVYPKEDYGPALIYFTGSDQFNRQMRTDAETKGYRLSDHGLIKLKGNTKVKCNTEEEVFKALGLPYKKPSERDL